MLGIGLAGGAEWLRRREPADATASYVPQALAAAGAATVFAAIYAAHQLYGLLPSGIAFALLAVTAGAAVALSLRHGPLVAALGLVGAYVVPLLVESDAPHALPLFAYLAIVTAASLALLRHRAWWWLVWFSLAGAMLWVPLWFAAAADSRDGNRCGVSAGAVRAVRGVAPWRPSRRVSRRDGRHGARAGGGARRVLGGGRGAAADGA